ncbi:MAG TPA: DUF433 domain-containing protein [Chitinophagales bacterium]|nr:DUF433 domain-containing protein [Chitinophagales bacterium]
MNFQQYIEINPEIRFGKPCLIGTRISVYDVLGWLASGMKENEIIADYPELNANHIQACLAYAADKERKLKVV